MIRAFKSDNHLCPNRHRIAVKSPYANVHRVSSLKHNVQLTSPTRDSVFGFQHSMRLSLPQLSNRSESLGHQANDKIPLQMIKLTYKKLSKKQNQQENENKKNDDYPKFLTKIATTNQILVNVNNDVKEKF